MNVTKFSSVMGLLALAAASGCVAGGTTPPSIAETTPAQNTLNVPINTQIRAGFTASLSSADVTFTLSSASGPVQAKVTLLNQSAILTPAAALAPNTIYTATFAEAADQINSTWTFTTGSSANTSTPTVVSTVPLSGATDASYTAPITVTFSKLMDPTTITSSSLVVTGPGSTPISGSVSLNFDRMTASFTPTTSLGMGQQISVQLTTTIQDFYGNPLAAPDSFSFTTTTAGSVYFAPGITTTFVVPAGITSITIQGTGGGGGGGGGCNGPFSGGAAGNDTTVTQTYAVTPGETLQVETQTGGQGGCGYGGGGGGAGAGVWVSGAGVNFAILGGGGGDGEGGDCSSCGGNGGDSSATISWN